MCKRLLIPVFLLSFYSSMNCMHAQVAVAANNSLIQRTLNAVRAILWGKSQEALRKKRGREAAAKVVRNIAKHVKEEGCTIL